MGWSKRATSRRVALRAEFENNVKAMADSLARHELSESVSPKHVDHAFEALSRIGLSRRRWTDRAEAQTALGSFLVGFAFACPSAIALLFPTAHADSIAVALLVAFAVVGVFFFVRGWYLGKCSPIPSDTPSWVLRLGRWLFWIVFFFSIAIAGHTIYVRINEYCCGENLIPLEDSESL